MTYRLQQGQTTEFFPSSSTSWAQAFKSVSLLGVDAAQQLVEQYTAEALSALDSFPGDGAFLRDLAQKLAGRDS